MRDNSNRIGKTFKLGEYDQFTCEAGVTDLNNMKSVYLVIKSTVTCKEEDDWMMHKKNLHYQVRQVINKYNNSGLLKPLFLSTPIIHSTFGETGKSFTQFDYTFFVTPEATFQNIQPVIKLMVEKIHEEVFENNKSFEFINHNWRLSRKKQLANVKDKGKQLTKNIVWEEEESGKKVI